MGSNEFQIIARETKVNFGRNIDLKLWQNCIIIASETRKGESNEQVKPELKISRKGESNVHVKLELKILRKGETNVLVKLS